MDSLAETITVDGARLVLGGWYAHPDFDYNCICQIGYDYYGEVGMLLYTRHVDGGWNPWYWGVWGDYDLSLLVQIER